MHKFRYGHGDRQTRIPPDHRSNRPDAEAKPKPHD
jgi:hypothetical protein